MKSDTVSKEKLVFVTWLNLTTVSQTDLFETENCDHFPFTGKENSLNHLHHWCLYRHQCDLTEPFWKKRPIGHTYHKRCNVMT